MNYNQAVIVKVLSHCIYSDNLPPETEYSR